jgi:hypothetical protein
MAARATLALMLGIALAGCEELHSNYLKPPADPSQQVRIPKPAPHEPEVEKAALRALAVAQKVHDANPSLPRATLLTVGSPKKTIFHTGNPQAGLQMYISDSLINACADDAQLAAVICTELGRIAAERAAASPPVSEREPVEERMGSDDRGAFGPSDGTRMMLAARREAEAKKPQPKADPAVIARQALVKAGYSPEALKQVAPLLSEAGRDDTVAEQMTAHRPATLLKPIAKDEAKK